MATYRVPRGTGPAEAGTTKDLPARPKPLPEELIVESLWPMRLTTSGVYAKRNAPAWVAAPKSSPHEIERFFVVAALRSGHLVRGRYCVILLSGETVERMCA